MSKQQDIAACDHEDNERFFYKWHPDEQGDQGFYFRVRERERARGPFNSLREAKEFCAEYVEKQTMSDSGGRSVALNTLSDLARSVC